MTLGREAHQVSVCRKPPGKSAGESLKERGEKIPGTVRDSGLGTCPEVFGHIGKENADSFFNSRIPEAVFAGETHDAGAAPTPEGEVGVTSRAQDNGKRRGVEARKNDFLIPFQRFDPS